MVEACNRMWIFRGSEWKIARLCRLVEVIMDDAANETSDELGAVLLYTLVAVDLAGHDGWCALR